MTKLVEPGASSMTQDQQKQEATANSVKKRCYRPLARSPALAAEPEIAVGFALRCGSHTQISMLKRDYRILSLIETYHPEGQRLPTCNSGEKGHERRLVEQNRRSEESPNRRHLNGVSGRLILTGTNKIYPNHPKPLQAQINPL